MPTGSPSPYSGRRLIGCTRGATVHWPSASSPAEPSSASTGRVRHRRRGGSPARNRIVSGLADAVVVVEAAARSGALITADFALDQGIPVLAVPGAPGAEMSAGCNALIRSGAALCEGVQDIMAEVSHPGWTAAPRPADGVAASGPVIEALARGPAGVDHLAAECGLATAAVAAALVALELEGAVVREPGGVFRAVARWG